MACSLIAIVATVQLPYCPEAPGCIVSNHLLVSPFWRLHDRGWTSSMSMIGPALHTFAYADPGRRIGLLC